MFRSFIYLDEEKLYSYLKQIDADYENRLVEISKKKTKMGTLGTTNFGFNSGVELEEKRELSKDTSKDYDHFETKLGSLAGEEYFDFVLNDYDMNTVPNMCIIRINGSFEIPEEFDMFNLAQKFMPLITSQIQTSSQDERELMEAFLGNASADIPVIIENDDLTISGKLSTSNLREDYAELEEYFEQEVFMLCKIIGKVQKNTVEIFNPLKDFIKLPRAVRRGMEETEGLKSIEVDGPVLKVEIIAIYK